MELGEVVEIQCGILCHLQAAVEMNPEGEMPVKNKRKIRRLTMHTSKVK